MGLWDTIKSGAKSLFEAGKEGASNLWNLGKSAVKNTKQFFDDGGAEQIGNLLKVGQNFGLSKGFSDKVSSGLNRVRDITKKAGDIQQQVDSSVEGLFG